MVMIANLQYGWTLFVGPIDAKYHWGRAAIQVAFSIFVITETWLVPVEGWFVPGASAIKTCMMHREVLVDVATGLRLPVDNRTRVVGCHTATF